MNLFIDFAVSLQNGSINGMIVKQKMTPKEFRKKRKIVSRYNISIVLLL